MAFPARPLQRPPSHPGTVAADILDDVGVSVRGAATALGMTNTNLDKILKGERPVTAETAVRFGVYFGNGPDIWLRMQADYDVHQAQRALAAELKKIAPLKKD
jgi:addiction module HigA family antidote